MIDCLIWFTCFGAYAVAGTVLENSKQNKAKRRAEARELIQLRKKVKEYEGI